MILIKWIKRLFTKKQTTTTSNQVYIDLGASSIKMSYNNHYITFRSTCKKVSSDETTTKSNVIRVDGTYYLVGHSNSSVDSTNYKCDKSHLEQLILFGLQQLNYNDDLVVLNLLLPATQMHTSSKLKKRLTTTLTLNGKPITLKVNQIGVEGESSYLYLTKKHKLKGNICTVNVGYSTTDITLTRNGYTEEQFSIGCGANIILKRLTQHIHNVASSGILNSMLIDGYKLEKNDKTKQIINDFLLLIEDDLLTTINTIYNPTIVFCGGTSLLISSEIKQRFKDYNLVVCSSEDSIYSDLKGLELIGSSDNDKVNNDPINEVVVEHEVVSPAKKQTQSKLQQVLELKSQGLTNKDIASQLGCSPSTINNMMCRYNKTKMILN